MWQSKYHLLTSKWTVWSIRIPRQLFSILVDDKVCNLHETISQIIENLYSSKHMKVDLNKAIGPFPHIHSLFTIIAEIRHLRGLRKHSAVSTHTTRHCSIPPNKLDSGLPAFLPFLSPVRRTRIQAVKYKRQSPPRARPTCAHRLLNRQLP